MKKKCFLFFHDWDGCFCKHCGKIRDQGHHWDEKDKFCLYCGAEKIIERCTCPQCEGRGPDPAAVSYQSGQGCPAYCTTCYDRGIIETMRIVMNPQCNLDYPKEESMKYAKRKIIAMVSLLVLFATSVAFAADPFNVHESGFGPEIQGLQLGKPMILSEQIATEKRITTTKSVSAASSPYLVPTPPGIFNVTVGDSYKSVANKHPTPKPGKWITILFSSDGPATIMNGGGGMLAKVSQKISLDDLLVVLEKNGLNHASSPHLLVRDNRVIEYSVNKDILVADDFTVDDFAQWLNEKYNLGEITKRGDCYEASNPAEGWRALVSKDEVKFFTVQIPDNPKK